jgi:hypothetical protein
VDKRSSSIRLSVNGDTNKFFKHRHLIDDGHGEEDARTGADGAHEVGEDREGSDAEAAEGCGRRNVTVEFVDHRRLAVATHHHLLLAKLLGDLQTFSQI